VAHPLAAADAAVSLEVPAGKSKNIRLRNLPAGGAMAVRIVSSGKLLVALVSAKQLRSPEAGSAPLFRAVVERTITFKVMIPESGDYFLLLSNRGGAEALEVQAEIRAIGAPRRPAPRDYSPRPEKASMSPALSSMLSSSRLARECAASVRR
jgi:hypothetical protein